MPVIGMDLGGTKLAGAVFDDRGNMAVRQKVALGRRQGAEVGALIVEQAESLIDSADRAGLQVAEAGVSIPGIYHDASGTVWAPNIPGWDDYPLRDEMQNHFGEALAVRVDSDRACSILGEVWRGSATDCRNAVFLAVGTGIGAGILVDGRILRGSGDSAGAIGWMALTPRYRTEYGSCGCFEFHASGSGIASLVREKLSENDGYRGVLRLSPPESLSTEAIFDAYALGDELATAVLDGSIAYWGMAAANLVSLFNPERIIFGGGVFGPAAQFIGRIREEAGRWAQPISIRQVTFSTSTLGPDAALYGAGRLAMEGEFHV